MHRRWKSVWAVIAGTCLLAASPATAGELFCRAYAQTWSSAGRCDSCRLAIVPTKTHTYRVEANNGWKAEVNRDGKVSAAKGTGSWSAGMRHAYAGKRFKIVLANMGKQLTLAMRVQVGGKQKVVVANFRCLDEDFAALTTP